MDFTDRMIRGEDGIYRWYYDRKYGQDNQILKTTAIILGSAAVLFGTMILMTPAEESFKWKTAAILLGTLVFAALLTWAVVKVMYIRRGGKYRTRYELEEKKLTVLYDQQSIDVSSAIAAFRTFARKEDLQKFLKHGKKTAGVFADYGFYLACGMSRYLQLKMPRQKTKITVDVNAPESEIIRQLNDFQPAMLSGYPSNLALLADFKELDIHPDVVITGGELLTDEIRRKLARRFGCYVQTHYSCTEGGEIACECEEKHLHINEDWVIVEPVDSEYAPVPYGEMSDKVLITNLSNTIQPFIRYELTDRVIVHDEKCRCGRNTLWLEIEGRTDDILEFADGVRIAPMSLYKVLEEVKAIRRFQLVQ